MRTLGEHLRELREAKDLSVRELARKLKHSAATISDIELGRRHPSADVLKELAREFGTTVEKLQKHDHRPPVDALRRLSDREPTMGFALRRLVDQGVTGDELLKLLEGKEKKKP
jgi:transcriptional regulator with XRE-family HTH domain